MFCPCFVVQYFISVLFCNHLDWEERAIWFTLTVFLMSCDSQCSVPLPHVAWVGLRCVIVVYPEFDTHLLISNKKNGHKCLTVKNQIQTARNRRTKATLYPLPQIRERGALCKM